MHPLDQGKALIPSVMMTGMERCPLSQVGSAVEQRAGVAEFLRQSLKVLRLRQTGVVPKVGQTLDSSVEFIRIAEGLGDRPS